MTTSKDYCNYVLEQLRDLPDIFARPMMGEYLIYCEGILVGGIYDERLLLKETEALAQYNLPRVIPYDTAKRTMYYIEDLDDQAMLTDLIIKTLEELKLKQPQSKPKASRNQKSSLEKGV